MIQLQAGSRVTRDDAIRPVVFAYDFPHKKSQDVIIRLAALGMRPQAVLAAPPVDLGLHPSPLRVKPRHIGLVDPRTLCASLGVLYEVVDHRSADCLMQLDLLEPSVGVVAGARILPASVIERFPHGIVNLHPGLLPHTRGLDALQWALYREQPLGVTAHLIDHRVDAGWLLEQRTIDEYPDDTFVDLSLRLYETQLEMLGEAVMRAATGARGGFASLTGGSYNRSFPAELVPLLRQRFRTRRARLRRGWSTPAREARASAPEVALSPR